MAVAPDRSRSQRVLWVEGPDDRAVTRSLCAAYELPMFDVEAKNGVEAVLGTFGIGLRAPNVERFGVVVDANGNPQARWSSIRRTMEQEGYTAVPEQLVAGGVVLPAVPHRPVFGAWVMPDNGSPGAVEDFAAALVPAGDGLWTRVQEAVDAIPDELRRFHAVRRSKALIHTWLSWQEDPGSPMGQAITKGDLDADADAARSFVAWLRRLFVE